MKKLAIFLLILITYHLPFTTYHPVRQIGGLPLLYAQEEDEPEDLADYESDQDLEDAFEAEDITEDLYEQLQDFYDNPIDINSADETELMALPGIELDDARKIAEERLKRGPYEKIEDLVTREAISQDIFEKIKILITAEKPGVMKTKGELRHETIEKPEKAFKTTADLEEQAFSPTTDKSRFKIYNIGDRFRIGGSFLGKVYKVNDNLPNTDYLTVEDVRKYRWTRRYVGYDAKSSRSESGWFKSDFLQQVYLGNYRLGFFEGRDKVRSLGFIADDRTTVPNKIVTFKDGTIFYRTGGTSLLNGFGAKIGTKNLNYTGFYSKDQYSTGLSVLKEDSITGKLSEVTTTVEDTSKMETWGGYLGYSFYKTQHLGSFWIRNESDLDLLGQKTKLLTNKVWGIQYKGAMNQGTYRALFARENETPFGSAGLADRNFYFGIVNARLSKNTKMIVSYKRPERGFFLPIGRTFGHDYIWRFDSKIIQTIGRNFNVRFDFIQEEKINPSTAEDRKDTLPAKKIGYQIRWKPPNKTIFQFSQYYTNKNLLEARGADKTVTTTATNDLKSKVRIIHKPSRKIENRVDVEFKSSKRQVTDQFQLGQTFSYRVIYQIASVVQLRGEFKYADTNVYKPDTETQTFRLELRTKPFRKLDFRLRWENKYQTKSQTTVVDGIEYEVDNPGFQNTITLRMVYKW